MEAADQITELKKRRELIGISQVKMAQLLGVAVLTFQLWEYGLSNPSPTNAKKLEEVLSQLEDERLEQLQAARNSRQEVGKKKKRRRKNGDKESQN